MAERLVGPSIRAKRIAQGLMRTGRAIDVMATTRNGFICLRSAIGGFYWVANDGKRLLRGDDMKGADILQGGFISAMERAGGRAEQDASAARFSSKNLATLK
jgi:hypothetical protein